jgi:hypothetical protein
MSVEKLRELALGLREARGAIGEWEGVKREHNLALVAELQSRREKSTELDDGLKVTLVAAEEVVYDWDEAVKLLKPAQLNMIRPDSVDPVKLARAVEAGRIPRSVLTAVSRVRSKAPYVLVSGGPPQA